MRKVSQSGDDSIFAKSRLKTSRLSNAIRNKDAPNMLVTCYIIIMLDRPTSVSETMEK